jgi:hypothetical protein
MNRRTALGTTALSAERVLKDVIPAPHHNKDVTPAKAGVQCFMPCTVARGELGWVPPDRRPGQAPQVRHDEPLDTLSMRHLSVYGFPVQRSRVQRLDADEGYALSEPRLVGASLRNRRKQPLREGSRRPS